MGKYGKGDTRENPERGVTIRPLPPSMHREFERFLDQYRTYVQSHISTYKLVSRHDKTSYAAERLHYWQSILSGLNHLEYQGTRNERNI